ncbi:MAG: hypothetical protein KA932_13105 [Giesbergeria sp.]|nr:hypothetical protein [Giesbergeria sp.]
MSASRPRDFAIGATVCQPGERGDAAIRRADAVLYQGKAAGRNQAVMNRL